VLAIRRLRAVHCQEPAKKPGEKIDGSFEKIDSCHDQVILTDFLDGKYKRRWAISYLMYQSYRAPERGNKLIADVMGGFRT